MSSKKKKQRIIRKKKRNTILWVGVAPSTLVDEFKRLKQKEKVRLVMIHDKKKLSTKQEKLASVFNEVVKVNFDSPKSLVEALHPYQGKLLAATTRGEFNIPRFQKVIPHIPYVKTPTSESLAWSTDKALMRKRFKQHNASITPKYTIVRDTSQESLNKIAKKVGYPVVIKPSGLASSLLVTIAYHPEELEKSLKKVFRKIHKQYRKAGLQSEPQVLVEQFMEGDMYSVDAYVNSRGKVYFCPIVKVKTGRTVGFDDFFGYLRTTPTKLSERNKEKALFASEEAIHALGLRSSSAHIELMKTEEGWKVIELGPRLGGFRDVMYELSYGINHTFNDILIRIPRKPIIPRRIKGYTAVMQFYAKKEGEITALKGIKKIKDLTSFYDLNQRLKVGDRAKFARHGGKSVFNLVLFNKDRSKLLADIRRVEQTIVVKTS